MVGFPGLGIKSFEINPDAFSIGSFTIRWYGIIIAIGFLLAVAYCMKRAKSFSILQDDFVDMLFWAMPLGIVGARLFYVLFNLDYYKNDPLSIIKTWNGGLAIFGGILAASLTIWFFCRRRKIHTGAMLDLCAFGVLIGQIVGRWGNFFNGELYGKATTLPWRMTIDSGSGVHPLFLYECLWNIIGFALLHIFINRRKFNGQIFASYVVWYGFGRGWLELLRDPQFNLAVSSGKSSIAIMSVLSIASALIAFIFIIYNFLKPERPKLDAWLVAHDALAAERKANRQAEEIGDTQYGGEEADGEDI